MPSGLEKPPIAATTSPLMVRMSPMLGLIVTRGPMRMPPTAASTDAMTNTPTLTRFVLMPSSMAASGLKATAWMLLPQREWNMNA